MRLIIAGTQTITVSHDFLREVIYQQFRISKINEIVSGMASGIDTCGYEFGKATGIKVKEYRAKWNELGKRAGHIRNGEMAEYGTHLLLIWDGKSPGSTNMKSHMITQGKPILEIIIKTTR